MNFEKCMERYMKKTKIVKRLYQCQSCGKDILLPKRKKYCSNECFYKVNDISSSNKDKEDLIFKFIQSVDNINGHKAYILGCLCGDASISQRCISLSAIDKEFVEFFSKQLEKWTGLKTNIYLKSKIPKPLIINGKTYNTKPVWTTSKVHKPLINYLNNNYKFGCEGWQVPDEVANSNDENIICMFLRGFFDSEGCATLKYKYRKKTYMMVNATSSNKEGLESIVKLLEKIGIYAVIYQKDKSDKLRLNYLSSKPCWALRINKQAQRRLFLNKVRFSIRRKQIKLASEFYLDTERVLRKLESQKQSGLNLDMIIKTNSEINEKVEDKQLYKKESENRIYIPST